MDFNEANKTVHPVEKQWHYPIMVSHGFEPINKTGVGFVRNYRYKNSAGLIVTCSTGYSADHWDCGEPFKTIGYWASLEPFLERIK